MRPTEGGATGFEAAQDAQRARILVVDEDVVVRELLKSELSAAGYEVDTLSSGDGFTEDMVALIQPDLLMVDPFIGDVALPVVERLLSDLRQKSPQLALVLIDSGRDPKRVGELARSCKANGQLQKRELLRSPANAVGEHLVPEVTDAQLVGEAETDTGEDVDEDSLPTAEMVLETGAEIELSEGLPPPRSPRPPAPTAPKPRAATRRDLLAMIEEELTDKANAPSGPHDIEVEVTLFSRHNFYVGATADLRSGGVFVATALLPRLGTKVPLRLMVPNAPVLKTEANVEWLRQSSQMGRVAPGVGLSLAHLSDAERHVFETFFKERAPLTHLPKK